MASSATTSAAASAHPTTDEQRKAAELKGMLNAPPLELPWPLLEASVSASRIKALAHMLDPSMELDDGAVKVRRT